MSGHDHCIEHLVAVIVAIIITVIITIITTVIINFIDVEVNHFLTGMDKECCNSNSNSNLKSVTANTLKWYLASNNAPSGVTSFTAFTTSSTVTYHDQTGTVRCTAPAVPLR